MSAEKTVSAMPKQRIASIDQFRGYAIFGMLLVDYFGCFRHSWPQLHHHRDFMTFADTVAPMFMFVVGMGMRLSMQRRSAEVGLADARKSMVKRYVILVLIAFTIYAGYLWDALMNIGLAGLLAVLLVDKKPSVRIIAGLILLAAYQAVFSLTVYGQWMLGTVDFNNDTIPFIFKLIPLGPELVKCNINGGPIGHWSWCLMLLCGTIAYDVMATKNAGKTVAGCLAWGAALCLAGWVLKQEWPGVKAAWPFSKYWMTAPFALWSSGLCFFTLLVFYVLCDVLKIRIPHLTVFGMNPLVIYILQCLIMDSGERFMPERSTYWPGIFAGFLVFYTVCYGTAYFLYRKQIIIKL